MAFCCMAFCFADDTILFLQNLIANLVIIINTRAVFAGRIKIGLVLPIVSNFVPVGYNGMPKSMPCPNFAVPGEALRTVWWVE
jgi:hypothetical protein